MYERRARDAWPGAGFLRCRHASTVIRIALADDAEGIAEVMRDAFSPYEQRYTARAYRATVPDPDGVRQRMAQGPVWVAVHSGAVVGTAAAVLEPVGCYIRGMAVHRAARGLGLGRQLLSAIEEHARQRGEERLYLSTTPFLDRAIALYERFGFQRVAGGPSDLHGTPLMTMEKRLDVRP